MGPYVEGIALGQNQDGRLELVATVNVVGGSPGFMGEVWHLRNQGRNYNWPPRWQSRGLRCMAGQGGPAIARNKDGRLEVAVTTSEELLHSWQTAPNSHTWPNHSLGHPQASADIAELEAKIEAEVAPFAQAVDRLDEITGVGRTAAQVIIAEVGLDMGRFPTPGHLASWAKFAPGVKQSAGKLKGKATTGHGNSYLARVLGEAAVAAGRTNTFLGERYRRLAKRRGTKKAIVAVGRSILIIIWHLLADPTARFHGLGAGFYDTRVNAERKKRNHVRQLEALGYRITLEPAA